MNILNTLLFVNIAMIYKINHGTIQEKIGPIWNLLFVNKGQVRRHKYNQGPNGAPMYYVYETLPEWRDPQTGEVTEAEDIWINFETAYLAPSEIKERINHSDDPTFLEESLYCLERPLTTEEIDVLIQEYELKYNKKRNLVVR